MEAHCHDIPVNRRSTEKMNSARIQRTVQEMRAAGLKQLIVSSPSSIFYYTGKWVHPGERMLALLIRDSGDAVLYANRLFALSSAFSGGLVEYDDTDDCVSVLAQGLGDGVLGIEKTWPSQFTLRLQEARPDIKMRIGSACVDAVRMIKDEEELKAMRESSLKNDETILSVISRLRVGMPEKEAAALYLSESEARGSSGPAFDPLICFGANCAEPHHISDCTLSREGDMAIIDVGLTWHDYCSDMTRTVCLGKATDEMKRVYDLVLAANKAGRDAVRPGVRVCDVDRAARKVIEDGGYGKYFIHRLGHGIGLECHEYPDISSACAQEERVGMVHSVEPGIYLPGKFGVRIEDLVAVTEDGCETLNHADRELRELRP